MIKENKILLILPIIYLVCVLASRFYQFAWVSLIGLFGVFVLLLLSLIISIKWIIKSIKQKNFKKLIFVLLLLIPLLDIISGFSENIYSKIKGDIVLSGFDDGPLSTTGITVREKDGKQLLEYENSVGGFGNIQIGLIRHISDSSFVFELDNTMYIDTVWYDKKSNLLLMRNNKRLQISTNLI